MNHAVSESSAAAEHARQLAASSLSALFACDPQRVCKWTWYEEGIYLDLSKNFVDDHTRELWRAWLQEVNMASAIEALFQGQCVNTSEQRPALHHLLRAPAEHLLAPSASPWGGEIETVRQRMRRLEHDLRGGELLGFNGEAFTDIIHIGIGGSELGPRVLCDALVHESDKRLHIHFLTTPDPVRLRLLTSKLRRGRTLVIVASKSFSTVETLMNARIIRDWLEAGGGKAALRQMWAVTAQPQAALVFGIDEDHILPFWDWVGGRFSLWSAIGLPFVLQNGYEVYEQLLAGAHAMDKHFRHADAEHNMPLQLALLDAWYNRYFACNNRAIISYHFGLNQFPEYLQQLEMESLGKGVDRQGAILKQPTGCIIWGGTGTECQHAFFQLLHQGQRKIPLDFIAVKKAAPHYEREHRYMLANCLAQSAALMQGRSMEQLRHYPPQERAMRLCPGNHPSTTMIVDLLDARHLGSLLALYEHKVYALSILYGINAFDQWGVELGKHVAESTFAALNAAPCHDEHDPSTQALLQHLLS